MKCEEVLAKTRDLISDPTRWTTGVLARDSKGVVTDPCSPYATCWCVSGALSRVISDNHLNWITDCMMAHDILFAAVGNKSVGFFNDTHTHDEVIDMLNRAIIMACQMLGERND